MVGLQNCIDNLATWSTPNTGELSEDYYRKSLTLPLFFDFAPYICLLFSLSFVFFSCRPTPLQHFVFPGGAEGLYLVVDEKGKFREENFQKAMTCLQAPAELDEKIGNKKSSKFKKNNSIGSDLFKIVRLIMDKELDPCIVFSFSKKDCETYALQMSRYNRTYIYFS